MNTLKTQNDNLILIPPNIERDAPLSVVWLAGDSGRETLRLMGNVPDNIKPTTLEAEKQRVSVFIKSTEQLTWMIEFEGKVVGSIWAHTEPTDFVKAPSIHIMIGDETARGKGVGKSSSIAVIDELRRTKQYPTIYSRYITDNSASASMLSSTGFILVQKAYTDNDGLEWQNVLLNL